MVDKEDLERIRAVKSAHEIELMSKANVVGVGIGLRKAGGRSTGEAAIVVSVSAKVPGSQLTQKDTIPRELDGVPVDVQVVGELRAFGA
jgi:hypothetical protein